MSEVVYRSQVRVERESGPRRLATLPAEPEPVVFGTHGAIAAHYGRKPGPEEHAATLDYVVAATTG